MLLAILAFLAVHVELEMKMLGTLRALGLRESVYWASWHIPLCCISLINALLGAITAQFLHSNVHAYASVYFGGVFGTLFFLNIALCSASMFLAALCSTSRHAAPWIVLLMLIGVWIPWIVIAVSSANISGYSQLTKTPTGLFWINGNTVRIRILMLCVHITSLVNSFSLSNGGLCNRLISHGSLMFLPCRHKPTQTTPLTRMVHIRQPLRSATAPSWVNKSG